MPQALTSEDLRSYFGHVAQIQGWQADPISREQLHVSEACICLELQHLVRPPSHDTSQTPAATTVEPSSVEVHTAKRSRLEPHGLARPLPHRTTWTLADSTVDRYMPAHAFGRGTLADSLAMHFPKGVPRSLLVVGTGGTGKIVLSKQILVACCSAWLEGTTHGIVPFRVKLADLAPLLGEADADCWLALRKCVAQTYGRGSMYISALEQALSQAQDILLVLDGFDDAPSRKRAIVARIARLDPRTAVVITSRPSAMDGEALDELAKAGFEGRRIAGLTPAMVQDVSARVLRRLGASPEDAAAIRTQLVRKEYKTLQHSHHYDLTRPCPL